MVSYLSASPLTLPTGYVGGDVKAVPGLPNLFTAPAGSTGNFYTVGPSTTPSGTAAPGDLYTGFSALFSTLDTFNTISFLKGGATVASYTGSALAAFPPTVAADGTNTKEISFIASDALSYFDTVKFESSSNAFESDNHKFLKAGPGDLSIPEPSSALALLGVGTALAMGSSLKRRLTK